MERQTLSESLEKTLGIILSIALPLLWGLLSDLLFARLRARWQHLRGGGRPDS